MQIGIRKLLLLGGTLLALGGTLHAEEERVPAAARDELAFNNGDRLTGRLIRQSETEIVFISQMLGKITVPAGEATVTIAKPLAPPPVETLVGIAPIDGQEGTDNPAQKPPSKTSPNAKPDRSDAEKIADAVEAENPWKGKLEFGLRQQQGRRDLLTFDLRGSADRKIGSNDLRANARLLYGEQDGQVNNDRYDASFQWRRELGKRTFAQSLTSYFQDDLKDIRRNWEQNVGAGYRLLDGKGHVVNLGAGFTGQYREAIRSESGFFALAEIFQDYTFRINKRLTIRQNAQFQYSPDGSTRFLTVNNQPSAQLKEATNYKVRFNTVLQGRLTDALSMNLRFEFEYDNAVSSRNARVDQRIISSLGYAF
ncbi:MAG: DUF481 domain-containing protein [Synoicihabitans sp.]